MVATPSAAAQTSEMERKRKQTLERTKANHLSRQLQMRLQYARLKVEHGWQRQNLNEVENLYFHHSHRGTKTHHSRPSLVVIPSDDNPVTFTSSNQLDASYKTSMSRSATLDAFLDSSGQRINLGAEAVPASTPTPPALLSQTGVGSHDPLTTSSAVPEVQTSQLRESSHTPNRVSGPIASSLYNECSAPEFISLSGSPSQPTAVAESTAAIVNPTPQRSDPLAATFIGNAPFTRTSSTPTPVSASPMKMPLLMHKNISSLSKNDKFSLTKSETLTYDSFWSGMQSKSYPALKHGGTGLNNQLSSSMPNATTSTTTALSTLSTQSLTPNIASSSTSPSPRPFTPSYLQHPIVPSSITSSAAPTLSSPSASTPTPTFTYPTTSFTSTPPMQQNRLFLDSLAAWNLIASQQTPGSINVQPNFITGPIVSPVMAYPCLTSLTTPYTHAFGVDAEIQGGQHSQGGEITGASSGMTPPVGVPPSNVSAVASSPVVVSTLVGQEGS
ncbi:hypothetical protein AGABI2DRAFT_123334 [Agaricus bisporus var. bisporus H97]|uniref:hypothetical protein n=1 Tax=Agaricus bisporus var. bisporus (strain H97 / ATCC MYA-4626 / FGSC 10389) TaxID=936046 RepID=UPI00029F53C8|nr:hypothetical protein AGABI2DRAFT_123334 [Agaricus bisporus var. bisporus H97]EKV41859.1 hypothetical protein AGABI2DRAFT_123334 [Agaricus bisporus var. bisporus H97]